MAVAFERDKRFGGGALTLLTQSVKPGVLWGGFEDLVRNFEMAKRLFRLFARQKFLTDDDVCSCAVGVGVCGGGEEG